MRNVIIVDCESNGLNEDRHQAVEVAWWNLDTNARGLFIPPHSVSDVLAAADITALQLNRYIDRIATAAQDEQWLAARTLHGQLDGATMAGSNPRFDAALLRKMFRSVQRLRPPVPGSAPMYQRPDPWHHRLWDLSAYAAGVLGLDELPGLARICELLDVPAPDHSADADVTAAGLCLRRLRTRAADHARPR